jgi:16S rRNA (adenine1518-N6/adenine1519-N6)-dimethyltransferase
VRPASETTPDDLGDVASGAGDAPVVPDERAASASLLSASDIRRLAHEHGVHPTKQRGQNFVIDPNTVRRIVATADVGADDIVLEVGPGLGSLTLGLLPHVAQVVAVEIDDALARALPGTVDTFAPDLAERLTVVHQDALRITTLPEEVAPTALVANLPYNVAVPVLLHLIEVFPSIARVLVMVQAEVAERLAAPPGSRTYGVPSAKARWYGEVSRAGHVGTKVFWPEPRVDSGLVRLVRTAPPSTHVERTDVFAVVDAAFAQRRKTLRAALAGWAGSADAAEQALRAAGIDPRTRGEQLSIGQFADIAEQRVASA